MSKTKSSTELKIKVHKLVWRIHLVTMKLNKSKEVKQLYPKL